MDLLRFQKFTVGYAWVSNYGSSDKAEEFSWLRGISPLHNIAARPECGYPAVLLVTADHDDRVVPLHSLKFIVELQWQMVGRALTSGEMSNQTNPILARIETRAGHGTGKPTKKVIEQCADVYAFVAAATNTSWKQGDSKL